MIEELRELYAFNRWANRRTLDAVAALDEETFSRDLGGSFASVREALKHLLSAEWVWLERWRGRLPTGLPETWDLSTLGSIRVLWSDVERDQRAYLAELTDADLERELSYRYMNGEPGRSRYGQMLRHVVNHASYHRGQVAMMLRQLGATAVNTDLITFYRLRDSGELADETASAPPIAAGS